MTQSEYDEIEGLVNQALSASNKKDAQKYISILEALKRSLEGSARNVMSELCASVKNVSGRVADKEDKEYFCSMDLFKLKMFVER